MKVKLIRLFAAAAAIMMIFAGCTPANYALKLLDGGAAAESSAQWLRENYSDDLCEELLLMLDSPVEQRAQAAKEAFLSLDAQGRDALFARFHTLTTRQRTFALEVLGRDSSVEGVMRLMTLHSFADIADLIPETVAQMGESVAPVLMNCMDDPQFSTAAERCFAQLDTTAALPTLITELNGTNAGRVALAEDLLNAMGAEAAAALGEYALLEKDHNPHVQAIILQHPQECIPAIAQHVCEEEDCASFQASLLAAFGTEYIFDVFNGLTYSADAARRDRICSLYADKIGVADCLAVLPTIEDKTLSAFVLISNTVSAKATDAEIAQYMLQTGDMQFIREAAANLLTPEMAETMGIIASGDPNAFGTLLESWEIEQAQWLGYQLKGTENEATMDMIESMLPKPSAPGYTNSLYLMAAIGGERFPKLLMDMLLEGNEVQATAALTAMVDTLSGNTFDYAGVDYLQYCDKLCDYLSSSNAELAMLAQSFIQRVPQTAENHEFFVKIFEKKPTRAAFESLANNFTAPDGDGITVRLSDGTTKKVTAVKLTISPSWKIIPTQDRPNMRKHFIELVKALGVTVSDNAADKLEISFTCTPLSKVYPGLLNRSYTGSEVSYTLKLTTADNKTATYSGDYTIACPERISVASGTYAYLTDPVDGPNQRCIKAGVCQGLGRLFGTDGLLLMYAEYKDFIDPLLEKLFKENTPSATATPAPSATPAAG